MAISKITNAERDEVKIYGLPDKPGLSKEAMQQRFDGLGNLAIDKINEVIDSVNDSEKEVKELSDKVDQFGEGQIPEEYVQSAVETYVNNNQSELATKKNLEEVNNRLSSDIVDLDNHVTGVIFPNLADEFMHGNLTISTSGWVYTTNCYTRIRMAEGVTKHIEAGTLIRVDSSCAMYMGWRLPDGTYKVKSWFSGDYITEDTADYVFVLRYATESEILTEDIPTVASKLQILSLDSVDANLSKANEDIASIKNDGLFGYYDNFKNASLNASTHEFTASNKRIAITSGIIETMDDLLIHCNNEEFLFAIQLWNGSVSSANLISDSGWKSDEYYIVPKNTLFTIIVSYIDSANISPNVARNAISITKYPTVGYVKQKNAEHEEVEKLIVVNDNVKAINHRGYKANASENTLKAFRHSKKMGWEYVETDVSFTSDNVAVLLHDDTIDRTSNGSGNIADMTFEEVRQYDFGGEPIPSFEEFVALCKNIGLKAYVELKPSGNYTQEKINQVVNIAKKYGMNKNVTWISFADTYLQMILVADGSARIGLVTGDLTAENINMAINLKNATNEVFIDSFVGAYSDDLINQCINGNIGLEMWGVNYNTYDTAKAVTYASGYTADLINMSKSLYTENIN